MNLLAALFSHAHSDASMRILHGYTSIGLMTGVVACVAAVRIQVSALHRWRAVAIGLWTLLNASFLVVNTWIAFQGMGISNGNLFHLAIAGVLTANLQLAQAIYREKIDVSSLSGDAIWQSK
ncbi:hypothetical protein [Synechococcus sp. KORDI-100]|uniref:hypothetical protein n=1 Tax=Synechococcus sp. KORDI-100 TaxID=1280380 RepID=UPI0012E065AE|nr:hypothetical protein [Synechococcus sp. KORDI-100]